MAPLWTVLFEPVSPQLIFLNIHKNTFYTKYKWLKLWSNFQRSSSMRFQETGLQILAMAGMFARNFFSREPYVIPFRAYDGKEILSGGTDTKLKEVWINRMESRISTQEIPKLLRQDLVANPITLAQKHQSKSRHDIQKQLILVL